MRLTISLFVCLTVACVSVVSLPNPMKKIWGKSRKGSVAKPDCSQFEASCSLDEPLLVESETETAGCSSSTISSSVMAEHKRAALLASFEDHVQSSKMNIYQALQAYLKVLRIDRQDMEREDSGEDEEEDHSVSLAALDLLKSKEDTIRAFLSDITILVKGMKKQSKYLTSRELKDAKVYAKDIETLQEWCNDPFAYHYDQVDDLPPSLQKSLAINDRQCNRVVNLIAKYNPHQQRIPKQFQV